MDPATVCCPTLACPARGRVGAGNIGLHSHKEQRCICTPCQKTFTTTQGTALSRLRTSAETVTRVVTLRAHGCPLQAMVIACGVEERTGADGVRRAGVQGQAVQAHMVEEPRDLGQVHADESRVKTQGGVVWMALAMMVSTRVWLAGAVSEHRDRTRMRRLIERGRAGALHRPLLCCPDGLCSSLRAMRETCRDPVPAGALGRPRWRPWRHIGMAQVVKRSAPRRVVNVARRIVEGTPARVETLRRRSQGDGVSTTASIERLNATFRERLASLTRRGRALARCTVTLQHGMSLVGTVEHCCTPQERVCVAGAKQTPAMAAGITDHGWTVRELLSFPVPPPRWTPPKHRGRPSHALKRLIEQWCGDHG